MTGQNFAHTIFLLKIRHENNLSFAEFLEVNIQHSVCVRILFPFIAYTRDDLCRKLEKSFGKIMVPNIRRNTVIKTIILAMGGDFFNLLRTVRLLSKKGSYIRILKIRGNSMGYTWD